MRVEREPFWAAFAELDEVAQYDDEHSEAADGPDDEGLVCDSPWIPTVSGTQLLK